MVNALQDKRPKRGPLIISRHGRPALDRAAGPRLTWQEYQTWWQNYEAGRLAAGQEVPADLIGAVADADLVLSSARLRAQETAALATRGRDPVPDALYNEAPLPPPLLGKAKFLPKTWNIMARGVWLQGHSLQGESVTEARQRAQLAAARLHDLASQGKVYLAGHGWFNRMLRPPLARLGWVCVRDGGDKYWAYRIYEYRGKV